MSLRVLILVLAFTTKINCKLTQVVKTTTGPVQGEILKTVISSKEYSSFKGIPYAEPPVGELRFKPPVAKKPWSDVLKTTAEGPNCVQKDFVYRTRFTGSEDCLHLNVYTPQTELGARPNDLKNVMVWIHGGSFKSGYGNSSLYGPDFIIEEDVVLVTSNYRLGALGLLMLNNEGAPGNAALKDQNLVLKWVQQNIAAFGGNPKSVTLFGQSAGGVAVDLHVLSDMSKGLFHRTISMSASPLCPWAFQTPKEAEAKAFELGYRLGLSNKSKNKDELLALLYKVPALRLMEITEELGGMNPAFRPTIEDPEVAKNQEKFLTECPYSKYKNGEFTKVPHLTGFTKDETLLFTSKLDEMRKSLKSEAQDLRSMPSQLPFKVPHFIDSGFSYIASKIEKLASSPLKDLIHGTSDILFIRGIDSKEKYLQKHNDGLPIYYYRFSYQSSASLHKLLYNIPQDGVAHGDDFAYLFYMTVVKLPLGANDPTFITSKRMVRMWTNFAKYSNPTPQSNTDALLQGITWPESTSSGKILDINNNLTVEDRSTSELVKFYEKVDKVLLAVKTGCARSHTFF